MKLLIKYAVGEGVGYTHAHTHTSSSVISSLAEHPLIMTALTDSSLAAGKGRWRRTKTAQCHRPTDSSCDEKLRWRRERDDGWRWV